MIGVLWMAAAAWAGCEDRSATESQAVSDALTKLVAEARASADPSAIVARVRALADEGGLCTDGQRLNAAYVLLEGEPDDLRLAHDLARAVYEGGKNPSAGATAARAWDSALVREGKSQDYGLVQGTRGAYKCLYSISDAKSDDDRAALGVAPRQSLLDAFATSAGAATPASLATLEKAGLLCDPKPVETPVAAAPAGAPDQAPAQTPAGYRAPSGIPRNDENLTYGELYGSMPYWSGNAYTVRKGTFILRPFRRSAYGITDHVQVGSSLLAWVYLAAEPGRHGANAFVEVAPVAGQKGAVSLEIGGVLPFRSLGDGPVVYADSELKGTLRASETVALTLAAYGGLTHYGDLAGSLLQPDPLAYDVQAKLGADISLGPSTMLVLSARNDVDAWWRLQVFGGGAGLHLAYAKNVIGISTGLSVERPAELVAALNAVPDPLGLSTMVVIPVPQFQLWFRL